MAHGRLRGQVSVAFLAHFFANTHKMNQLHVLPTLPRDHEWSTVHAQHYTDDDGNYLMQPSYFDLFGLKGNLNKLFKDKQPNVLSDIGQRWTSEMYPSYPHFDKLQRDKYGRVIQKFEEMTEEHRLQFANLIRALFRSGQKSRFITSLNEAAKQEVLRRYRASVPEENYFRVPQPQSIDDVLDRLTGSHQQDLFRRGNHAEVYTHIFNCFKTLPLSDKGSAWLSVAIQSYINDEGMMVVLASCNQCPKSRKHSLVRWASKKVLGPLGRKVETAEAGAFGCKIDMNTSVDINSPLMSNANCVVVRIRSRFMPTSRHTERDGRGPYYLLFKKKENPAASVVKQHFSAALNAGRASGMSLGDIKKELYEALKEFDVSNSQEDSEESPREEPPEEVVNEGVANNNVEEPPAEERDDNEADAIGANDDEERPEVRDDNETAATAACIHAVDDMLFGVSLLHYL